MAPTGSCSSQPQSTPKVDKPQENNTLPFSTGSSYYQTHLKSDSPGGHPDHLTYLCTVMWPILDSPTRHLMAFKVQNKYLPRRGVEDSRFDAHKKYYFFILNNLKFLYCYYKIQTLYFGINFIILEPIKLKFYARMNFLLIYFRVK